MTPTDPGDLDRVIDSVARNMTSGDPQFVRTRVLAALDAQDRPWRIGGLAGGVTAIAAVAVVMAVLVNRQGARPQAPGLRPDVQVASASSEVASAKLEVASPPSPAVSPSLKIKVRSSKFPPNPTPSADELSWRERAVPALEEIDPLTLANIQPASLQIRPLVTEPLSVPALDEDDD